MRRVLALLVATTAGVWALLPPRLWLSPPASACSRLKRLALHPAGGRPSRFHLRVRSHNRPYQRNQRLRPQAPLRRDSRRQRQPAPGAARQPQRGAAMHGRPTGDALLPKGEGCPNDSQIGVVKFYAYGLTLAPVEPLYMMTAPGDGSAVARLGFIGGVFPIVIRAKLRSDSDYGVNATVEGASGQQEVVKVETTVWGVPAAKAHDQERCTPQEAFPQRLHDFPTAPAASARRIPTAADHKPDPLREVPAVERHCNQLRRPVR